MAIKMDTSFQFKRLRKAELIIPPNRLKEKVGWGGLDQNIVAAAQKLIESCTTSFEPIAETLLDLLDENIRKIMNGALHGEEAIEGLIFPIMQMKSQGAMFGYPLISDLCGLQIDFLEMVPAPNKDVLDIIIAHKLAIKAIIRIQLKNDGGVQGVALREELRAACLRYLQAYPETIKPI